VDKLASNKTITIKINGENRSFQEEIVNQDTFTKNINFEHEQIPVNSWTDSPQKKQESFKEAAASQEIVEESFDWVLPEPSESEINEYKFAKPAQSKKNAKKKLTMSSITSARKKNGIFKSLLFSILFAVLIGISFGILMLKLVVVDHSKEAAIETSAQVNKIKSPVTSSSQIDVTLKAYTAFVVQGGVYSTKAAANGISNLAISKGAPSEIIETEGKNFLFLGLADSIDRAKNLGDFYKQNGVADIWAKSFPVPEKTFTAVNQDEKNFLDMAQSLFQMLSEVTSNAIVNQTIPNESLNSITKTESDLIGMESGKFKNTKIKNLKSELVSAMSQVKNYQKSNDKQEIIKAQQHLLKYFSLYYSL
jgi:stage II sporulation protein B